VICKKCKRAIGAGLAQQSFVELEAIFAKFGVPRRARRRALAAGPLCDDCLAAQRSKQEIKSRSGVNQHV
jgi:hypothetical protein